MKPVPALGMATLGSGIIAITYRLTRFVFGLSPPVMAEVVHRIARGSAALTVANPLYFSMKTEDK